LTINITSRFPLALRSQPSGSGHEVEVTIDEKGVVEILIIVGNHLLK
jgi:hypothetical protein